VDGEGCVHITKKSPSNGKPTYSMLVEVGMSESGLPILQELHRVYGGILFPGRAATLTHKPIHTWRICSDEAVAFLQSVRPYLIIKATQADVLLEFQQMRLGSHYWTMAMRESAERMKQEIHRLNRRGPRQKEPPPSIQKREIARFVDGRWVAPQGSLFPGQPLDEFSGIFPRSGSMRAGVVYEVPMSAIQSSARGSSLWPAPTKADARSSGRHTTSTGVMHHGTSLTDAVRAVLRQDPEMAPHCEPGLPTTVVINPEFVEALLGFPIGWSALDPSETVPCPSSSSKPSDDSETG
jgi:hypothetical protein